MSNEPKDPDQNAPLSADELEAMAHDEIARGHAHLAQAKRLRSEQLSGAADTLIDKSTCTILRLTPRSFEDNARKGAFPAFKSGRRVVARRADVELWIQSRKAGRKVSDSHDDYLGQAYDDAVERVRGKQ